MARAFWKGSISFGLVEIPVTLHPVVQSDELSFSLLDRKDFSPIGNKRYNKNTGREVPWEQVIRGYEYGPDEYVVLSDEELRRANVKASETIEILEFVDAREIDPVYFDTPYYVEPVTKASKSYALLRAALEKTGRVGIARVVLRTRQRLGALMVHGDVLVLNLLRYFHELRKPEKVDVPAKSSRSGRISGSELTMAEQLIEGMRAKWAPGKFRDEYRDDVMALVRRKVKSGQTHTILEPEGKEERRPARSDVVDLMPLLKKSLESRRGKAKDEAGRHGRGRRASTGRPQKRSA